MTVGHLEVMSAALFLRDRFGLGGAAGHQLPPPVDPPVGPAPRAARHQVQDSRPLEEQWRQWWVSLVEDCGERWGMGAYAQWTAGEPLPRVSSDSDLAALIRSDYAHAPSWAALRRAEFVAARHRSMHGTHIELDALRVAHRRSSRSPRDLHIVVLPVAGVWGLATARGVVLVSTQLHRDRDGYGRWLAEELMSGG